MSESDQEKTEDPTQKRLEDAKKKGQVAYSREVTNFFMILGFTFIIAVVVPYSGKIALEDLQKYISLSDQISLKNEHIIVLLKGVVLEFFSIAGLAFLLMFILAMAPSFLQNGFNISAESLTPKLEKISIIKGFGRIFSMRSMVEFLKGIIKIIIVGIISYVAVVAYLDDFQMLPEMSVDEIMAFLLMLSLKILIASTIVIFLIAIADLIYQKHAHIKQLMMSKQEIKDEYKQQEGDPVIKGKLKAIRMERARKRMMQAVPNADVVITNPTHYAVALKYEHDKMDAPIVLAIGRDNIALRIKAIAEENKVPIVRNAPLARALADEGELDKAIPIAHFQAVAEIISYVYKLKGKKFR